MTLPYGKIPPPTCTWKCLLVLSSLWWIKGPCISEARSAPCPPDPVLKPVHQRLCSTLAVTSFLLAYNISLLFLYSHLQVSLPDYSPYLHHVTPHIPAPLCRNTPPVSILRLLSYFLSPSFLSYRLLPVSTLALIFPKQWSFLTHHIWSQQHLISLSFRPPWKTFFRGFYVSTLSWSSFHVTGG